MKSGNITKNSEGEEVGGVIDRSMVMYEIKAGYGQKLKKIQEELDRAENLGAIRQVKEKLEFLEPEIKQELDRELKKIRTTHSKKAGKHVKNIEWIGSLASVGMLVGCGILGVEYGKDLFQWADQYIYNLIEFAENVAKERVPANCADHLYKNGVISRGIGGLVFGGGGYVLARLVSFASKGAVESTISEPRATDEAMELNSWLSYANQLSEHADRKMREKYDL